MIIFVSAFLNIDVSMLLCYLYLQKNCIILDRLTVGDYREMITDVSYNTTTFMLKIKLINFCEILTINVDE